MSDSRPLAGVVVAKASTTGTKVPISQQHMIVASARKRKKLPVVVVETIVLFLVTIALLTKKVFAFAAATIKRESLSVCYSCSVSAFKWK